VISWALLLAAPAMVAVGVPGLAYVSVVSMFAGFVAWYRGLATGGVARIAQLQLAQPVLTLGWSALLLGEQVTLLTVGAGLVVVATVAATLAVRGARPTRTTVPDPTARGGT
jgi:drug/metabolite transporter (DMT)-like permease